MYKVAVLISGRGSNLKALIDDLDSRDDAAICGVFSDCDAAGLSYAKAAAIPYTVIDRQQFSDRHAFELKLQEAIDSTQPDLVVLAGFMRILSASFVDHYAQRLLNIHPSLLPDYPGLNTHQRVLAAGDQIHGASIHLVSSDVDAGAILCRGQLSIGDSSLAELTERVHSIEHIIYPRVISWFIDQRIKIEPNTILLDGQTLSPTGKTFLFDK